MWRDNSKIGFDDRLVMLIAVPLIALLIPIIFFDVRFNKPPYYNWNTIWTGLLITSVVWMGNRFIMIWARTRYPSFALVKKRLVIQSLVILAFTLLANNILGTVLQKYCGLAESGMLTTGEVIFRSNVAAVFFTLTIVAIYESIYFMNELRQSVVEKEMLKRESLNAQLDALRTQVNPHFLFNNLNTLSSVIADDPNVAIEFVQQLSKVYRHVLEVKDEQSISLQEELDVLKAYAFLLQTRFGSHLNVIINVPEEKLKKKIVPLSLQLLMENAIKHNIVSSDKPLNIHVYAQNGKLVVTNNLQKKNQVFESTGIGLDNIRNRYKLIVSDQVEVTENESSFTVAVPLIEN
jgi:sensor histidine kinase YesM